MTDDTLNAILRRVIMEPAEDTHRLVYADRLDELRHGQRAEYVRESVLRPDIFRLFEEAPAWSELPAGIVPSWLRGFVCELTCDAATFFKHADALIWHETQTVECPRCGGDGSYEIGFHSTSAGSHEYCARCGGTRARPGTGRVPRPCPPTAQPIRKVVLTTELPDDEWGTFRHTNGVYTFTRWPGIEFEFHWPTTGTEAQSDDGDSADEPSDGWNGWGHGAHAESP